VRQTVEFLTLLAVLINICAAAYIIYRDPHRLENRLFALIASMLAVTCFGEYLMASGADAGTVLTGDRIAVSFWILMAAVFIHFAMVVSGWTREKRRGYLVGLYTFCGILTLINVFSRLFVKGIDFAPAALNLNHEIGGPLWLPLLMLLGFLYFVGVAILLAALRSSESRAERRSIEIICLAAATPVAGVGIAFWLLPPFDVRIPLGYSYFTPFAAVLIAYAITRYDLMTTVGSRVGRTLISSIREAVLITGDMGTIEIANEAAAQLTGYTPDELTGEKLERVVAGFSTSETQENSDTPLLSILTREGQVITATASVSPIRSRRGSLLGSVVILHDMREAFRVMEVEREAREAEQAADTERNKSRLLESAREELRERSDFLQKVLDNLTEPVFIKDDEFKYIYANQAFLDLTGLPKGEVLNRTASEVFGTQHAELMDESDLEAFGTGNVVEVDELDMRGGDGGMRTIKAFKVPVADESGRPEYLIGVIQDRTEQKRLERARLDFIRIAAHELRTPLTSLKLATELLGRELEDRLDEHEERTLEVMMLSLQRLILLTRNLLDLASMDAGLLDLRPVTLDIGPFISEVVSVFQYDLAEKQLGVEIEFPDGLPPAEADPVRMSQVVANLMSNAIKYTETGEIRITARETDGVVEVCVADTGCGIEKEHLGSIFSRFSKAQSAARAKGGSGLGLSIARGIVEAHGGRIWAESEPGEGSRFYFTVSKA
jgi:PAS domain S-box-containing protein